MGAWRRGLALSLALLAAATFVSLPVGRQPAPGSGFPDVALQSASANLAAEISASKAPESEDLGPKEATKRDREPEIFAEAPAPAPAPPQPAAAPPAAAPPPMTADSRKPAPPKAPQCFVQMDFCRDWEGFAGTLRYNQHVIAAAVKYGCAYVCSERPSWKTASHNTGTVDDWFGCLKGGVAVGALAAAPETVAALPVKRARFHINDAYRTRKKRTAGVDEPMLTGASISLRPEPNEHAVYALKCPKDSRLVTFEATYPWLRVQFAAGRKAAKRTTPQWGEAEWRIAMQLRRGDRPNMCPLGIYLNALRDLLHALPGAITSENSQILLVGELLEGSREFKPLRHLNVRFLTGKKTMDKHAKDRLARDLDYLATSNVLILGGGGGFAAAAGALQAEGGVILHARTPDLALDGLPHAHSLEDSGHFRCAYDLHPVAAAVLGADWVQSRPKEGEDLLAKVERSIAEYKEWYMSSSSEAFDFDWKEPPSCKGFRRDPLVDPTGQLPF